MAESPPQTVLSGRYVLHEEMGRGGMASVWRATDEVLDRPVAVKILHEHLFENPEFRERFTAEALAAARLTHPNILNVFDTGSENGLSFIVMELFEGRTLAEVLRTGPLEPDRAVAVLVPVLSALQFGHENGVVHRDVKPGNILVGDTGMVKVTDLGIARAAYASADVTTTGRVLGSVPYLSPEQVQGSREIDGRSDVYAAGVVLYEALTGRPPFSAETDLAAATMRLSRDPLPPRAVRPGIPRALEAVVTRAMARKPEDRFQSAENMSAALIRFRGGPPAVTPFPPRTQPVSPVPRPASARPGLLRSGPFRPGLFRSWMLVPALAVLLAVVAIVIGLSLGKLQIGGPLGIETKKKPGHGTSHAVVYPFAGVTAFDPFGTDGEHDSQIPLATDGNPQTYWTTENYNDLNLAPKPGVGLLFDLGSPKAVAGFRLQTPFPGYEFQVRVGDDPTALSTTPGRAFTAQSDMTQNITPTTGRYVLLWITTVVPGVDHGNRAAVGEFHVFGG